MNFVLCVLKSEKLELYEPRTIIESYFVFNVIELDWFLFEIFNMLYFIYQSEGANPNENNFK